tara:strand:- start:101 stop:238 length:138 start_codon:yes stop_codon:yes gene_type:complete
VCILYRGTLEEETEMKRKQRVVVKTVGGVNLVRWEEIGELTKGEE